MKKLFTLLCFAAMSIATLSAQEQEQNQEPEQSKPVVSSTWNRPSVSYIMVEREWAEAADVKSFYSNLTIDDKYDQNIIATDYISVKHNAGLPSSNKNVNKAINNANIGQQIMSYIFDRQSDGTFSDARVKERGMYNAKDQDIQNLEAVKVKEQAFEWGEPLVDAAYVVALDVYNTKVTKDDKGTTYAVYCAAHAFKLNASKSILKDFYAKGWADESYSEDEKAAAVAAYNEMQFEMEYVLSVDVIGISVETENTPGSIYLACQDAYNNVVFKLEKKIDAWKTTAGVIAVDPIAAKIGTKESLKNGDRFQAYSYKENANGELKSVKHGMVRATVISDNKGIATGDTQPSYFYQISGVLNVQDGYIIQQNKDWKIGAALTAGATGGAARFGLDFDYIYHIDKVGRITYAMVNYGFADFVSTSDGGSATIKDVAVGAGYGIPLTRFFEITPLCMVGGFYQSGDDSSAEGVGDFDLYSRSDIDYNYDEYSEASSDMFAAYFIEPAVRCAVTLQPFSAFLSLGAHIALPTSDYYELGSGIVIKMGVKWTF